jgi:hypothetical protein
MVYRPGSAPNKEGDKPQPWSRIAVFKLQAEEALAAIDKCVAFSCFLFFSFLLLRIL